jgi:hypothetical protein
MRDRQGEKPGARRYLEYQVPECLPAGRGANFQFADILIFTEISHSELVEESFCFKNRCFASAQHDIHLIFYTFETGSL